MRLGDESTLRGFESNGSRLYHGMFGDRTYPLDHSQEWRTTYLHFAATLHASAQISEPSALANLADLAFDPRRPCPPNRWQQQHELR